MRWSSLTRSEFEWHRWFAWKPVWFSIDEEGIHWVWMESVERKRIRGIGGLMDPYWIYREVSESE